ncbi:MAG: hypothetical protein K0U68_15825 [Gammaproteobacteria bacterium]|nr:hypothetical protein [Gammaproteobacteria bacterium]
MNRQTRYKCPCLLNQTMRRCVVIFVFLVLNACGNDIPQFKDMEQYDPLSVAIGQAFMNKFKTGIGTTGDADDDTRFENAFAERYGVSVENALIACVEQDVVSNLTDQSEFFREQWFGNQVNDSAFSVYIGNKQIKELISDCMTPMANTVYKTLN